MNILFPEGMMEQLIFGVQRERNQLQLYETLMEAVGSRVSFQIIIIITIIISKEFDVIFKRLGHV